MNHPDEVTLLRYRYDTLVQEDADVVASHLRTCSQCMSRFAELGQKLDLLSQWEVEDELPDGLSDRIMQRVRQRQEQRGRPTWAWEPRSRGSGTRYPRHQEQ